MEARVAIATSDGKEIDQHFGRARDFRIYLLEGGRPRFVERRVNVPPCDGIYHNDQLLDRTVELLSDCRAVAAARIGSGAIDALLARGILPLALESTVEEALGTLANSKFLL
ncbi:MAG: dinitrogenase iron-molybdenum cofactor biosynthesis protein [Geobacter sp.]|nr:dinitrogenase iron-molybdenum cofactor biosynthesis protein [Geobacter sp.]